MINIPSITSKALQERQFEAQFPEYYQLATVTENSTWHDHQNVLDHVIGVFRGLETVLDFDQVAADQKAFVEQYLAEKIEHRSRLEILKVATLLHDIAKNDTLVTHADGTSGCPGHELIGAARVKLFSDRFDLGLRDAEYVERIVRYHGFISEILNLILSTEEEERYLKLFMETVGDVAIELVLLMHADLLGCDLAKNDQSGYNDRISLLEKMLTKLMNR